MLAASEYADLTGPGASRAYRWEAYDSASKVDLSASALGVDGKIFFVDPIPLAESALAELLADGAPAGIAVTNGNHARAAEDFRHRWGVPLTVPEDARMETGLQPDHTIPSGGGPVFGGIFEAVPLPGGASGEVALYRPDDGGLLIVGDAIINLPSFPLALLPDKYCADPKLLRRSVTALLDRAFSKLLFAHGEPLLSDARARLAAMLAAWKKVRSKKAKRRSQHRGTRHFLSLKASSGSP